MKTLNTLQPLGWKCIREIKMSQNFLDQQVMEVLEKLVKVFFSFSFWYYEHGEVENFADCRSTCEQNNRQLYMGSTTL